MRGAGNVEQSVKRRVTSICPFIFGVFIPVTVLGFVFLAPSRCKGFIRTLVECNGVDIKKVHFWHLFQGGDLNKIYEPNQNTRPVPCIQCRPAHRPSPSQIQRQRAMREVLVADLTPIIDPSTTLNPNRFTTPSAIIAWRFGLEGRDIFRRMPDCNSPYPVWLLATRTAAGLSHLCLNTIMPQLF